MKRLAISFSLAILFLMGAGLVSVCFLTTLAVIRDVLGGSDNKSFVTATAALSAFIMTVAIYARIGD